MNDHQAQESHVHRSCTQDAGIMRRNIALEEMLHEFIQPQRIVTTEQMSETKPRMC